jgi:predicted amidohydrolase
LTAAAELLRPRRALRLALLHLDARRGRPAENRQALLDLCDQAGSRGASVICAPEMCLSGYVFDSRQAVEPHVETADGPTAQSLARTAARWGAYVCAGWAERAQSGLFFNSAFAFGPDGRLLARRRKLRAERRWAADGAAVQDDVFETPWGRVGLLVCADVWLGLLPRAAALKGAALLLVPANWPPTASFPLDLWRLRAWENGLWLAVANRGGAEAGFDCTAAQSCVVGPDGQVSAVWPGRRQGGFHGGFQDPAPSRDGQAPEGLLLADLPLDADGRLPFVDRSAGREPERWRRLAAGRPKNFSPPGRPRGRLVVHAAALDGQVPAFLELKSCRPGSLILLPRRSWRAEELDFLAAWGRVRRTTFVGGSADGSFFARGAVSAVRLCDGGWTILDLGPARALLTDWATLAQPETAAAAVKAGVDLLLCPQTRLSAQDLFWARLRAVDQLPVAVAAPEGAVVSLPPEGHGPGQAVYGRAGRLVSLAADLDRRPLVEPRLDYGVIFGVQA